MNTNFFKIIVSFSLNLSEKQQDFKNPGYLLHAVSRFYADINSLAFNQESIVCGCLQVHVRIPNKLLPVFIF